MWGHQGSLREQWSAELRGSNWGLMLLNIGGGGAGKQVAHRGPQNLCGCLSKVCGPGLGLHVQRVVLWGVAGEPSFSWEEAQVCPVPGDAGGGSTSAVGRLCWTTQVCMCDQRGHIQGIRTIPSRKGHTLRTKLQLLKGRNHDSGFLHNTHQTCEESENVTQRSGPYDDPKVRFSRQGLKQLLEICLRTWRKGWSWWAVWGCQQKKGSFKHDLNGNIKAKSFKIKNLQTCSRKHRRISAFFR